MSEIQDGGAAGAAAGGTAAAGDESASAAAATAAAAASTQAAGASAAASQVLSGDDGTQKAAAAKTAADEGDWRAKYTEGLPAELADKAKKYLERRASPQELLKSALAADGKISELSTRVKLPAGKGDDPADVEAFRKAWGVPEAADKYTLPEIQGVQWSEAQKGDIGEFFKAAHAANMNQAQAEAALNVLAQSNARQMAAFQEQAKAKAETVQEDLRAEYGRDYKANLELANRWVKEQFAPHAGENGVSDLMNVKLADGTHLGEHPAFARWAVAKGREAADHGVFELGDGATGGVSPDKRVDEIMAMKSKDPKAYASPAVQDELKKLVGFQMRRDAAKAGQ